MESFLEKYQRKQKKGGGKLRTFRLQSLFDEGVLFTYHFVKDFCVTLY